MDIWLWFFEVSSMMTASVFRGKGRDLLGSKWPSLSGTLHASSRHGVSGPLRPHVSLVSSTRQPGNTAGTLAPDSYAQCVNILLLKSPVHLTSTIILLIFMLQKVNNTFTTPFVSIILEQKVVAICKHYFGTEGVFF